MTGPRETTDLDRLRDLLDGRLAPADVAELRARIAAEPALRADFEMLRDVHALTALPPDVVRTRVTADDVVPRGRTLRLRPWVAAAVMLAAAAVGVAANVAFAPREPRVVRLAVLRAHEGAPVRGADVPAELATFRPVRDGAPNWVRSWDEGRALARASGRPILLWIDHPECPYCIEMDRDAFRDAGVLAGVESFVPVRVSVLDASEDLQERITGWPYMAAVDADGRTLREITSVIRAPEIRARVGAAAAEATGPSWDDVRRAAARLADAQRSSAEDRLGEAWTAAHDAATAAPGSAASASARALADALERRAISAIDAVRDAPGSSGAAQALQDAAERFRGSVPGDELAAVVAALREDRVFPRLEEMDR